MQFLRKDSGGACPAEGRARESLRGHGDRIDQCEDLAYRLGHRCGDGGVRQQRREFSPGHRTAREYCAW
jgi:hypothetical protein